MTRQQRRTPQASGTRYSPGGRPTTFVFGAGGQSAAFDGIVFSDRATSSPSSSSWAHGSATSSSSSASPSRNWVPAWTPATDGSMSAVLSATPERARDGSRTPRRTPVQTPPARTPPALTPVGNPAPVPAGDIVLPSIETPRSRMSTPSAASSPSFTVSPHAMSPSPGAHAHARFPIRPSNDLSPGIGSVARALAGVALSPPVASPGLLPRVIHRVEDEEIAPHRFHAPEVQAALNSTRAVARRLAEVLGSGRLHMDQTTDVCRLKKEAEELARFEISAARTVGIVGNSGGGKSSLINSLLDQDGLARTSNAGGACTYVATEYNYHDRDDFIIEIEFFSREEVKTQMIDLLPACRHHHSQHIHGEEIEGREELAQKAALAEATFSAMFGERANLDFLCARQSEEVLADLRRWADEVYPAKTGGRRDTFASASTCSAELEKITSRCVGNQEAESRWPFIRRVRVFLRSHVLKNGLVLVDLPGLHDSNVARIAVTERELQKCDEVFAVARIGRATTDAGIVSVFDLATRFRLTNVGIICTASDQEEAHEAEKDRTGHVREEMQLRRRNMEELKKRTEHAEKEADQLSRQGGQHFPEAYSRYRELKDQCEEAEEALTKYMVETRNEEVTRSLGATFRDRAPDRDIRIFCVSSKIYREHREDSPSPQPGRLDWLALSGIVDLRRHCLGLTADGQLRALTAYVGDAVPGLISRVGLWAAPSADGGLVKEAVREALDEFEGRVQQALRGGESPPLAWIHDTITTSFIAEVYLDHRMEAWTRAAAEAGKNWRMECYPTFDAFCRKHGVHQPAGRECRNWNEEAIQAVVNEVDLTWGRWVMGLQRQILHDIVERLRVAAALRGTPLVHLLAGTARLGHLIMAISTHRNEAVNEMERLWGRFAVQLRDLHARAFTGDAFSMTAAALAPAYDACNMKSGKNSGKSRKDIMEQAVRNPELIWGLMHNVKLEVGELATVLQHKMEAIGEGLLVGIGETLDLIRGENAAAEGERDSALRRRVAEEVDRGRVEMARLGEVVSASPA